MAQTQPYPVPSLIGGVSQQSPQETHPSMCLDQQNCHNDPLEGVKPRAGGVVLGSVSGYSMSNPFCYEIQRDDDELYQVVVESGAIRVFNMLSGVECTVTNLAGGHLATYLTHTGDAITAFDAVTVEDTTFLVNRQVTVLMDEAKTDARDNQALFYFKAGGYKTTYRCRIKEDSAWYQGGYTTPDNSSPGNAKFIATNRLASETRAALESAKSTLAPDLNAYTFSRIGSCVVVNRSGSTTFGVDCEDGAGDTQLIAIGEWVKTFSDLPSRAPSAFKVGVRGEKTEMRDDYWLKYSGAGDTTGSWEEIVKPDTKYKLDKNTMPLVLLNTAKNTFTIDKGEWGERVCGDGVRTAKNPTFVGKKIRSLGFSSGRLCCMTSGGLQMSRSRNVYTFFPDTAQARLATDPIGFDAANGSATLLHHLTVTSKKPMMWGDRKQIIVDSGDSAMTEESAGTLPTMQYEYDGRLKPLSVGMSSLIFTTKRSSGNSFKEILMSEGMPQGEVGINEHCPKFTSGTIKGYASGTVAGMMVALIKESPTAYLYQWRNRGNERTQSAWNKWTFPGVDSVVAMACREGDIYGMFKIGTKLIFERFHMDPEDKAYKWIRLDHRVDQTGASWSGVLATLTLPYAVAEADQDNFVAIENEEPADGRYLGRPLAVEWLSTTQVRITALTTSSKFWFGSKIDARRTFQRLYIQTQQRTLLPRQILLEKLMVSFEESTHFAVETRNRRGELLNRQEWDARQAFPFTDVTEMATAGGEQEFHIGQENKEVTVTLINDTPYPSRWVMVDWYYGETIR